MKTIYGEINNDLGVVVLTDEVLKRIDEFKGMLINSAKLLKENDLWKEEFKVELTYGKYDPRTPTDTGNVLVYGDQASQEKLRCISSSVYIVITPKGTTIHTYGYESSVDLLGYLSKLEDTPDVYFSDDFVGNYADFIVNKELSIREGVKDVYDDMPKEHKEMLDKKAEDHIIKYDLVKDAEELKAMIALSDRRGKYIEELQKIFLKNGYARKVGFDYHGVIDDDPMYFANLSREILTAGGEVHILTGSKDTPELHKQLATMGIMYTSLFSISSYHASVGTKVWEDEKGPWMEDEIWNKSKAEYCKRMGIDLHIDDSEKYGKYFGTETTYFFYNTKKT